MMLRSIKKQLQDTELGTGSGTNRHTYTYSGATLPLLFF
jgi:hypothetical protein